MTSNEDAETGYKPLKRVSPTPLYYPLILLVQPSARAQLPKEATAKRTLSYSVASAGLTFKYLSAKVRAKRGGNGERCRTPHGRNAPIGEQPSRGCANPERPTSTTHPLHTCVWLSCDVRHVSALREHV